MIRSQTHHITSVVWQGLIALIAVLYIGLSGACSPALLEPPPLSTGCQSNSDCPATYDCKGNICSKASTETKQTETNSESKQEPIKPTETPSENPSDKGEPPTEIPTEQDAAPPEIPTGERQCTPGEFLPCYTGPAGTEKQSPCSPGTQICQPSGQWSKCINEVTPKDETCDKIDNNCDGQIDENLNCPCNDGETRPCGTDTGECKQGTQTCDKNGKWGTCAGGTEPITEVCDGKDNDCDGEIDEDFTKLNQTCTVGQGICVETGVYVCKKDGKDVECSASPGKPQTEVCDGKDNDCDGQTDEDFKLGDACTNGDGICQQTGKLICDPNDPSKTICDAKEGTPQTEACNGLDDDCDGKIDNGLGGKACTAGKGECKATGKEICDPKLKQIICEAKTGTPTTELCDNKDNDCDGNIDNGISCGCTLGQTRPCGNATAPCKQGTQTCDSQGQWGPCTGGTSPQLEICNNIDDDCDGTIDNNTGGGACTAGKGECKANGKQVCKGGKLECDAKQGNPSPEICDGKDNDCDGQTDEGVSFASADATCDVPNQLGACKAGRKACRSGQIVCEQSTQPKTEVCRNNQDDDCDGKVDEICGPLYPYAIVNAHGSTVFTRDMTVSKTGTGTYKITSSISCSDRPIFLSPRDEYMRPISYTCSGKDYIIHTGKRHNGSVPSGKVDAPFYAVIPVSGEAFAVVDSSNCTNGNSKRECRFTKQNTKTSSIRSVNRSQLGTGNYFAVSSLCQVGDRPIFASVKSATPGAFLTFSQFNNYCYVTTRDKNGDRQWNISFAMWLPDPNLNQSAWATITRGGWPNYNMSVGRNNNFGDQTARWSESHVQSPNSNTCPDSGSRCTRVQVDFPARSPNSAFFVGLYVNQEGGASIQPGSNGKPLVTITDNEKGRIFRNKFSVLFVQ